MANNVNDNLQALFSKMESFINTKTVVGEPSHFGDITLIPLVEASFGAGTGLKEKKDPNGHAGGGGLGARITPVAVIVIVDGTVQLVNVKNQESVNKLIDMIPGVLQKFNLDSMFSKKDKTKVEEESAE